MMIIITIIIYRSEGTIMLDTSEERIKMLKKGFTHKQIEERYVEGNSLKIVHLPVLFEMTESIESIERQNDKEKIRNCEITVEYTQQLYEEMASPYNISQFSGLLYNNPPSNKTDMTGFI